MKPLPAHQTPRQAARSGCGQEQNAFGTQPLFCPLEDRSWFSDMLNEIKHGDGRELALGVRRESCLLDLAAIDTPGAEQPFTGVRAKFGVLNCKSIPPHLLCEVCKITSRGATIQEPLLSRSTCPQPKMAQLVGIRSALHFANDLRIQFTLVVNKVGRVVNLPEGLVVGLRKNGLQAALWASPMIWNFLAKTQNHFCGTGKAWIHGNPLAHFNEARTTTPRGVPSGASAVTSKVPRWVSTLVPAGGNLQPDRHNKVARYGPELTFTFEPLENGEAEFISLDLLDDRGRIPLPRGASRSIISPGLLFF